MANADPPQQREELGREKPIPIALCGRSTAIARGVIDGLRPEFEVIHLLLTSQQALAELPALLSGTALPPPTIPDADQLGTRNYTSSPAAVVLGTGYTDADVDAMRSAVRKTGGRDGPWVRPDMEVPMPPVGPEYGRRILERAKMGLVRLFADGRFEGKEGVVWY